MPSGGDPCEKCGGPVPSWMMDGDICPNCGFQFPYEEDIVPTATKFKHGIKTDRKVIAVCEVIHHYSIIDGSVNDSSSLGEHRIPVTLRISNVPLLPGESASFTHPIMLDYSLEDAEILKAIGIEPENAHKVDIDGDGTTYNVNRVSDGCPLYEVRVESWDEVQESD